MADTSAYKLLNDFGNTESTVASEAMKDHNVIPAYRFQLKVNGVFDVPLKAVRPIARKYEYEPIQEGGLNDYVHIKRKPISQPYELVVERYVQTEIDDKLAVGSKMTLPLILYIGRANGRDLAMTEAARWYVFTGAQVLNVEWGGLDSERAGLLTETVTIGYNMMFCLSSSSDLNDDETPFDLRKDTDTTEGYVDELTQTKMQLRAIKSTRVGKYAQKKGVIEKPKTDLEKEARLWQFDDKKKEGKGKSSRQNSQIRKVKDGNGSEIDVQAGLGKVEAAKETYEGKRSLWQFALQGDAGSGAVPEGNGVRHVQNAISSKDENGNDVTSGLGRVQATKAEMEATAKQHLFEFGADANSIMGNGNVSSQNYRKTGEDEDGNAVYSGIGKEEKSKKDLEAKVKLWKFDKTTKNGTGDESRMNAKKAKGVSDDSAKTSGVGYVEKTKDKMEELAKDHLFAFGQTKNEVKGNGNISARKDEKSTNDLTKATMWEFDKKATDTTNPPMEGNGKFHTQNATKGKDSNGKDVINGIGRVETRKADMEKAKKLWAITDQYTKEGNGVRSAQNAKVTTGDDGAEVTTGVGTVEDSKKDMEGRKKLWDFNGTSKDGTGDRSRQNANKTTDSSGKETTAGLGTMEISKEQMEKGAKLWNYSGDFRTSDAIAERIDGELRKEEMEEKADVPEPIGKLPPNQPKARQWKFSKTSKAGKGTPSRVQRHDREELSKADMEGKAKKGYYSKRPSTGAKPEKRLWPDEKSAVSGGNPNPQTEPVRKWPEQSSAVQPKKGQKAASRVWPQASSATKPKAGQKPEVRKWPDVSSAEHPQQGQAADQRKWPDTASAAKNPNPGKTPAPRLWPQVRSAQTIADFLMQ